MSKTIDLRHYFAGSSGSEPNLKRIVETWVARAT